MLSYSIQEFGYLEICSTAKLGHFDRNSKESHSAPKQTASENRSFVDICTKNLKIIKVYNVQVRT
jgi:hypothetical protein